MAQQVSIDPGVIASLDNWRMQDIIDFERETGTHFFGLVQAFKGRELGDAVGDAPFAAMVGLAWIVARQDEPELTWSDACNWTFDDLQARLGPMAAPTEAAPLTSLQQRGGKAQRKNASAG